MIYYEDIVNITLFFFFTLPRFRNHIFFPPFSAMPFPQLLNIFLFPHFNNGIATISLSKFFFFFSLWALHAHLTPGHQNWVEKFRYPRCRNSTFSLSTFFFFYLILLIEFRQWWYRNSVSLLKIPNNFQQFL